ncbi:hypothetical protein Cantr_09540 [Candida viswanathii]|uniref:Uncharacterized protein n=1 Tax=Candida viswanathii TaxID=5486 RepID=A0A367YAH6_9ASCO|nr:hypothetical protein Cantr_09540 [Candida viswanathii]
MSSKPGSQPRDHARHEALNPVTSPRLASRQPINLESIKRTKQHIDRQIKLAFPDENKENRKHLDLSSSDSEDPLSSPLKRSRNHQDKVGGDLLHPSKIPKISFDKAMRKLEHKNDYVTPERMTEPVAKSPETHQNIRVIEEDRTENFAKYKDNTSPSKRGNDEVVDCEDTANSA